MSAKKQKKEKNSLNVNWKRYKLYTKIRMVHLTAARISTVVKMFFFSFLVFNVFAICC